tara:strand:+ start:62318 stop:63025 length:708 start_codon:yes stop_codon:yes gene_type:complete
MRLLIVSTSKIYGSEYMEYLLDELEDFYKNTNEILFIPYARPSGISFEEYTSYPKKAFAKIGKVVKGIHEFEDPKKAIKNSKGIFTGGGNSFVLLKTLYDLDLIDCLADQVKGGTAYMGSSAGSNIAGMSIGTSNDMPIVYPPSFNALALLPFNINPHYLDPDPDSKHQGETRATRIGEFHHYNSQKVVGLREGSWLRYEGNKLILKGNLAARIFSKNEETVEMQPGDLSILLKG